MKLTQKEYDTLIDALFTATERWRTVSGLPQDVYGMLHQKKETAMLLITKLTKHKESIVD